MKTTRISDSQIIVALKQAEGGSAVPSDFQIVMNNMVNDPLLDYPQSLDAIGDVALHLVQIQLGVLLKNA